MDPKDSMLDEVLQDMLGDTEKETDKSLFPESGDGHTVTITISSGGKPTVEEPKPEEEPEDGGYSQLMDGLK